VQPAASSASDRAAGSEKSGCKLKESTITVADVQPRKLRGWLEASRSFRSEENKLAATAHFNAWASACFQQHVQRLRASRASSELLNA
jgi:hypothetical protein